MPSLSYADALAQASRDGAQAYRETLDEHVAQITSHLTKLGIEVGKAGRHHPGGLDQCVRAAGSWWWVQVSSSRGDNWLTLIRYDHKPYLGQPKTRGVYYGDTPESIDNFSFGPYKGRPDKVPAQASDRDHLLAVVGEVENAYRRVADPALPKLTKSKAMPAAIEYAIAARAVAREASLEASSQPLRAEIVESAVAQGLTGCPLTAETSSWVVGSVNDRAVLMRAERGAGAWSVLDSANDELPDGCQRAGHRDYEALLREAGTLRAGFLCEPFVPELD